jgi:hypothetical protein
MFGGGRSPQRPSDNRAEQGGRGRQPQLPPRGGPRAELPGGNPQQRGTSWGDDNAQPSVGRSSLDAPRGHEEPDVARTSRMPRIDDRQGPGSTAEIPRIDERQGPAGPADFGRPGLNGAQDTGRFPGVNGGQDTGRFPAPGGDGQQDGFVRPDVFGAPGGQNTPAGPGRFAAPQAYDNGSTGQFATPGYDGSSTGQHSLPGHQDPQSTGQFERPQINGGNGYGSPQQQPVPPRPTARPEPDNRGAQRPDEGRGPGDGWALPPAPGPGDGRTPLYDTLETNWFRGQQGDENGNGSAPAPQQQQPQAPAAPQRSAGGAWRTSPNDELVRQAERVRQPAAELPACRAGCPGRTSSRARLSSNSTKAVRRSRARLTTCADG